MASKDYACSAGESALREAAVRGWQGARGLRGRLRREERARPGHRASPAAAAAAGPVRRPRSTAPLRAAAAYKKLHANITQPLYKNVCWNCTRGMYHFGDTLTIVIGCFLTTLLSFWRQYITINGWCLFSNDRACEALTEPIHQFYHRAYSYFSQQNRS